MKPTAGTLRDDVLAYLSTRPVKHGERVIFGWFVFDIILLGNGRIDLQSLDFKEMASFTRDLTEADKIYREQVRVVNEAGVEPEQCCLGDVALVSNSYVPGQKRAFMHRLDPLREGRSGWFLGIPDDPLNVNDPGNMHLQSLYELTIRDRRLGEFWMLPVGWLIEFDGDDAFIQG